MIIKLLFFNGFVLGEKPILMTSVGFIVGLSVAGAIVLAAIAYLLWRYIFGKKIAHKPQRSATAQGELPSGLPATADSTDPVAISSVRIFDQSGASDATTKTIYVGNHVRSAYYGTYSGATTWYLVDTTTAQEYPIMGTINDKLFQWTVPLSRAEKTFKMRVKGQGGLVATSPDSFTIMVHFQYLYAGTVPGQYVSSRMQGQIYCELDDVIPANKIQMEYKVADATKWLPMTGVKISTQLRFVWTLPDSLMGQSFSMRTSTVLTYPLQLSCETEHEITMNKGVGPTAQPGYYSQLQLESVGGSNYNNNWHEGDQVVLSWIATSDESDITTNISYYINDDSKKILVATNLPSTQFRYTFTVPVIPSSLNSDTSYTLHLELTNSKGASIEASTVIKRFVISIPNKYTLTNPEVRYCYETAAGVKYYAMEIPIHYEGRPPPRNSSLLKVTLLPKYKITKVEVLPWTTLTNMADLLVKFTSTDSETFTPITPIITYGDSLPVTDTRGWKVYNAPITNISQEPSYANNTSSSFLSDVILKGGTTDISLKTDSNKHPKFVPGQVLELELQHNGLEEDLPVSIGYRLYKDGPEQTLIACTWDKNPVNVTIPSANTSEFQLIFVDALDSNRRFLSTTCKVYPEIQVLSTSWSSHNDTIYNNEPLHFTFKGDAGYFAPFVNDMYLDFYYGSKKITSLYCNVGSTSSGIYNCTTVVTESLTDGKSYDVRLHVAQHGEAHEWSIDSITYSSQDYLTALDITTSGDFSTMTWVHNYILPAAKNDQWTRYNADVLMSHKDRQYWCATEDIKVVYETTATTFPPMIVEFSDDNFVTIKDSIDGVDQQTIPPTSSQTSVVGNQMYCQFPIPSFSVTPIANIRFRVRVGTSEMISEPYRYVPTCYYPIACNFNNGQAISNGVLYNGCVAVEFILVNPLTDSNTTDLVQPAYQTTANWTLSSGDANNPIPSYIIDNSGVSSYNYVRFETCALYFLTCRFVNTFTGSKVIVANTVIDNMNGIDGSSTLSTKTPFDISKCVVYNTNGPTSCTDTLS